MSIGFLTRVGADLFKLSVRVKPGARTSSVCAPVLLQDTAVECRVAAPPVEGKANEELVSFIEEELAQQLTLLRSQEMLYLEGTMYEAAVALSPHTDCEAPRHDAAPTKRKGNPCEVPDSSRSAVNFCALSRVGVELLQGSTSRNKILSIHFPGGSAALLVAMLEKAAS